MKKTVKLKKGEAIDVTRIANNLSNMLIAQQGLRQALVIARLIHEKVNASYRAIERKYPNEKIK